MKNSKIISQYNLFQEYVDPFGTVTRQEFESMGEKCRREFVESCFPEVNIDAYDAKLTIIEHGDEGDVIEWSNAKDAEIDTDDGTVWYNGHWASDVELIDFAEWLESRD
jgi:hypothetical protein